MTSTSDAITIDGFGPLPLKHPGSVAELVDVIRAAGREQAIYPVGGGTMLDREFPPARPGWAVDLLALDQVIDYPARDMTITVQAGITLSRLQSILEQEGQRLPIDVPFPVVATLGGAIACNASGPRRFGYGTFRDYVIGISVVNADGQEVKAGGRVVKNVAGYDLCKLYTGSLGTLGIITQVTLKVRPQPQRSAIVETVVPLQELESALARVHLSRTRPVMVTVIGPNVAEVVRLPSAGVTLLIGFEESAPTVDWQVNQLMEELTGIGLSVTRIVQDADAQPLWDALRDEPLSGRGVTLAANILPSKVATFLVALSNLTQRFMAHAGNGIVIAHLPKSAQREQVLENVQRLRILAEQGHGNLIVTRCPAAWKRELAVWGAARGDAWLMREVKRRLDPGNVLNPGRWLQE